MLTFVVLLLAASGLQSLGATRPRERHDAKPLHGETQGLVLLHCPRTSPLWDQPDLGVQSGQAEEHRHPHAGHPQVASCSLIFKQTASSSHMTFSYTRLTSVYFTGNFQEHVYFRQSPDQRRARLLRPHTGWQALCDQVLRHTSFPCLQLCCVKLWSVLGFFVLTVSV